MVKNGNNLKLYDGEDRSIGLSSFVDNIYACARQADSAVSLLEGLEEYLGRKWRLTFGADSKQVMQIEHAPDVFRERGEWVRVEEMKTLGQRVSHNGNVNSCVEVCLKQMWGAFHANMCPGLMSSTERARFAFIQNSLMSIATWRWGRWPYSKVLADKLDSTQSHFVQILFPLVQGATEQPDAFCY